MDFLKITLGLKIMQKGNLPRYKGSLFRGALGNSLKKLTCINKNNECLTCPFSSNCIYISIFEPEKNILLESNYHNNIPRGFIISGLTDYRRYYQEEDSIQFDIILVGKIINSASLIIYAFQQLQEIGLGKDKIKFLISDVLLHDYKADKKVSIYSNGVLNHSDINNYKIFFSEILENEINPVNILEFRFQTWTRVQHLGRLTDSIDFTILLQAILRRLKSLSIYDSNKEFDDLISNYQELFDLAKDIVIIENELEWEDWNRYSRRENKNIKLGGFKGRIRFQGNDISKFIPIFKMGEIIHIGKNTTFGLGQYEILYR